MIDSYICLECGSHTKGSHIPGCSNDVRIPPEVRGQPHQETTKGTKHDTGKPDFSLISPIALTYLAQVLSFGAQKYAAHNWRQGLPMSRLIAASSRHLAAINAGIDLDEETGLPHAAHLMCECMFMLEPKAGCDDRFDFTEDQKALLTKLLKGEK